MVLPVAATFVVRKEGQAKERPVDGLQQVHGD
jgi:hypothetical protein